MSDPTNIQEDEKALVALILEGDEAAADRLALRHRQRLYAVAVAVLGYLDPEAEDAVQETLAAGFKGLKEFEFRSSLNTWLTQICVRQCYRRIRERKRRILLSAQQMAEMLEIPSPPEDRPLQLDDEKRLAWLQGAVASLKEPCAALVKGRDVEGLSYVELSRKLKLAMGTVMSRLARCRQKLKAMAKKSEWA